MTRDCKVKREQFLRPVFPHVHEDTVTEALERLSFGEILTTKDLAREVGCADSTMYDKIHNSSRLKVNEFIEIARLALSRGAFELIDMIIEGTPYMLTPLPDDSIESLEEEIGEEVEDLAAVRRDCKQGRFDKAERDAARLVRDSQKVQATVKRMKRA